MPSNTDTRDFTADLGPIHSDCKFPMFSFNRVSVEYWNAFANELLRLGLTEEQVMDELQSKATRWLLDEYQGLIHNLAKRMAKTYIANKGRGIY
jgi:hypothetical protein